MPTWARIGKRTSETLSVAFRYLFGLFARFAEWSEVSMRFDYPIHRLSNYAPAEATTTIPACQARMIAWLSGSSQ